MLGFGPLLSVHLGDFWSTAAFIPARAGALWAVHVVQTRVIRPRLGVVEFSAPRKRRFIALGSVMQLFVVEAMDATFLLNRTGLTWGNLSSHLAKLEDAEYVVIEKTFRGKKPWTMIRLTEKGRNAFQSYRARMQEALSELPDD